MVYLVWIILGFLALAKKNSKNITQLIYIFILILFCFNTSAPDTDHYILQYEGKVVFFTEPLYVLGSNIARNLGFNFYVYRGIIAIISVSIIRFLIFKFSPYPALVLFLYSIYPLAIDIVQLRFTIGYSLALLALYNLIQYQITKVTRFLIFFITFVLMGTCCHYSVIFYLIFILLMFDIKKHAISYLFVIPLLLIFTFIFINKFAPFISNVIGEQKAYNWLLRNKSFSFSSTILIFIARGMPLMYSIFLSLLNNKNNKNDKNIIHSGNQSERDILKPFNLYLTNDENDDLLINKHLILCVFYVLLFSIFEVTIAGDYERLQRLALVLSAILITRQISKLKRNDRCISLIMFIIMYILYFSLIMFVKGDAHGNKYISSVFRQVFENNLVFHPII